MADENNKEYEYLFKYIIIGDTSVGKSNLSLRFINNEFKNEYNLTVGVEFGEKDIEINNKNYRIQIWDTAGQEQFKSITRTYYKNCVCAIIVYDITSKDSFNNVVTWINDCRTYSPKTVFMVLVGNKSDLNERRQVNTEEGEELAEKNRILFFETSAKDGSNVNEIFKKSAEEIIKNIDENYYDLNNDSCGIKRSNYPEKKLTIEQKPKKKKCCK